MEKKTIEEMADELYRTAVGKSSEEMREVVTKILKGNGYNPKDRAVTDALKRAFIETRERVS